MMMTGVVIVIVMMMEMVVVVMIILTKGLGRYRESWAYELQKDTSFIS